MFRKLIIVCIYICVVAKKIAIANRTDSGAIEFLNI
jgi:hypothetical protein